MFQPIVYTKSREENYEIVIRQLESLIDGEEDLVANMANASALLHHFLANINWVGFYIWKENELVLGPFQGLPACIRIPYGKGVCGTAVKRQETIVVPNVNEFPGHIVCDAQSKSEIVVPLIKDGEILGVLDIDSPIYNRFDETDRYYLEKFVQTLIKA
ncbi:MAG TPA: GAF domain-containing protein [Pseudogracilibacillus sp.]|nr:GAF domain-containing protein [Pseudogracilibacillus sp.]